MHETKIFLMYPFTNRKVLDLQYQLLYIENIRLKMEGIFNGERNHLRLQ